MNHSVLATDPSPGVRAERVFVAAIAIVCIVPELFHFLFGVDFGIPPIEVQQIGETVQSFSADDMHRLLRGAFNHTILQWTAFCVAVLTWSLTVAYYRVRRDVVAAVIGVSLFWAGCIGGFHTFAASRMLGGVARDENLASFTWAICRLFNAAILLAGTGIVLYWPRDRRVSTDVALVSGVSAVFGFAAFGTVFACSRLEYLPKAVYADSVISRPWDLAPLVLYVLGAAVFFRLLHARERDFFSLALWGSAIPQAATQFHMAFGSRQLFDHHFNMAHFFEIVAYLALFAGLVLNYVCIHRSNIETQQQLLQANAELHRRNRELNDFARLVSHDLKSPLRAIENLSQWVDEDAAGVLPENSRSHLRKLQQYAQRMTGLLDDLLEYTRAGRVRSRVVSVDTGELVRGVIELIGPPAGFRFTVPDDMPVLMTARTPLSRVFRDLIGNAVKHHDSDTGHVEILWDSRKEEDSFVGFCVRDDGPGITPEFRDRAFQMFQTLHASGTVNGNGLGLAIVKKLVEQLDGEIHIECTHPRGTSVRFTWPRLMEADG